MKRIGHIKIIFVIGFLSVLSHNIFAYNGPQAHKHMGERAVEESYLDEYLKENLGFSKGIETKFKNPDESLSENDKTKSVKELYETKNMAKMGNRIRRSTYSYVSYICYFNYLFV